MNASDIALANAIAAIEAAEADVRAALAVRDLAGDAYQLACRLHNNALAASSVANKAYFKTACEHVTKRLELEAKLDRINKEYPK